MHSKNSSLISIDTAFLFCLAAFVLIVPLRLLFAWSFAILIHELGHYIALRLLRIRVLSVNIGLSGVFMDTEPVNQWQEALCAVAGPLSGLCVLPFSRWMPCTAIFALVHSLFNLLPFYPLDGGRVLKGILLLCFTQNTCDVVMKTIKTVGCVLLFVLLLRFLNSLAIVSAMMIILYLKTKQRKTPCKQIKQIVQ